MKDSEQEISFFRENLLRSLPISVGSLVIRPCVRSDLDLLVAWPQYPEPYDVFQFSFASLNPSELDSISEGRNRQQDRLTLVADRKSNLASAYIALVEIDWQRRRANGMAIRVHPQWCGRGIGTCMLKAVCDWWFGNGMRSLQLDVASTNQRALRCYTKLGFSQIGEFWRKADDLKEVDLRGPKYEFLKDHVRFLSGLPEVRFWWMQLEKNEGQESSVR